MKFDFNALNFEILDANTNAYPDIFINQNGVTFTKKVLDDLNYPAFVLCQLDAKNKVFAVRMCKSSEQRGYKFSKPKGEQKATVSITNKNLVDPIRAAMEGVWQSDKRYRVRGFWVADAKTMCFDLSEGVQEDYRNAASDNESEELIGERIVHRLNFRMTVGQAHYGLAPCLNKGGYLQIVTHKGQISEM